MVINQCLIHIKLFFITALILSINTTAQIIQSNQAPTGKPISPELFGIFFEDINYAADGGLYAELVQNRSFEYNPAEQKEWHPLSFWEYISPGYSNGQISVETSFPVHSNNPHYVNINIEHVGKEANYKGLSGVGLQNAGFDGMVVKAGEKYKFSLFARQLSDENVFLTIALQNPQKEILAQSEIKTDSKEWKNYTLQLIPSIDTDSATLVILATSKGKISLDVISLFPENTFKKRKNGLRADLAQAIADIKPRFLRFPGGCLVHGDGLRNMYRWKNTIGPVEHRKEQRNYWGYHQTAGLGYYEYFQFCEDIGAKPLPVVPAAVSCQNSGGTWKIGGTGQRALPLEEMENYIQEVLDLIEWANGPDTSFWGAKRAAAGHPAPFNLSYIGIGNEDKITPEFQERFRLIYQQIKSKHPEITVIGTSGPFPEGEDFTRGWEFANAENVSVVDEHYYKDPKWLLSNQYRYDTYPRHQAKVYLGEYASWGNKMHNAIAEAAYMTGLERNGDIVSMASYAPLLAKKDHIQWKTNLIFFDNKKVWLTPNYYVQKIFSLNSGAVYFDNIIQKNNADSSLAASCVQDLRNGDIILKLVNAGNDNKIFNIDLSGFGKIITKSRLTILSGDANDEMNWETSPNFSPEESIYNVSRKFNFSARPMSLSVIRIKTK